MTTKICGTLKSLKNWSNYIFSRVSALFIPCCHQSYEDEHTLFLRAVKSSQRHSFVYRKFLVRDAEYEINVSGIARSLAIDGDYCQATREVEELLKQNQIINGNSRRIIY
jgi:hypothetical protein